MIHKNQIEVIKNFLNSNENTLLINQVSDDITEFYFCLIRHLAMKKFKISFIEDSKKKIDTDDLFGSQKLKIYKSTNAKFIDQLDSSDEKIIIFSDYRSYKKYNTKIKCINGYQFDKDISLFIQGELGIKNDELIFYCKNNPALSFSEISKFLVNNERYIQDQKLENTKDNILVLRKKIFEIKKKNLDIKKLYSYIKNEAKYKRFNFLTY